MPYSEQHKIGKRAGVVSFFTLLSRILGLIRDAVVANFFGASATADAFYVAFRIPNLFRRLTAEGALTIAFIPIFSEYSKKSRDESKKVASIVFTYLSFCLVIIVLLGVIFAPYLVKLIAYGFTKTPEKFSLTVYLTRLMFPYIFFISLTALAMGILNSLKRFAAPAASPIFLNIFIILGAALFSRWFAQPIVGLAVGVLVGGISQVALQLPFMKKEGMIPRINFNYKHPALKGLLFLMLPAAFGAAVYQVNVLIVTLLASFLPHGSVSYLWYADRLTEFPLGIFAIAIATATLPSLSDYAAEKDIDSFKKTLRYSLRVSFVIIIPAAVGLFILSKPVVKLLFERGVFTSADTIGTAGALIFFVIGLPFVSAVRNIVPAFFALKDAKTPVLISAVAVVVNAICASILMNPLLHRGLALSIAISAIVNFTLLCVFLRKKIGAFGGKEILKSVIHTLIGAACMGSAVWSFQYFVVRSFMKAGLIKLAFAVFSSIAVGMVVYLIVLKLSGAPEYSMLMSVVKRKEARITRSFF